MSKEAKSQVRMRTTLTSRITRKSARPWTALGARVAAVFLLGAMSSPSCRREVPADRDASQPASIETAELLFRVPGYEDKIDLNYGVPLQGAVAASVRYDLGALFPATEFFDAIERHLRSLGWFSPEFAFSNPPELASEAATWRTLPRAELPIRMRKQWWVRADEVLCVVAQHVPDSEGRHSSAGNVDVIVARYYAAEAERMLKEYGELHGTRPTRPAASHTQPESDSTTTGGRP